MLLAALGLRLDVAIILPAELMDGRLVLAVVALGPTRSRAELAHHVKSPAQVVAEAVDVGVVDLPEQLQEHDDLGRPRLVRCAVHGADVRWAGLEPCVEGLCAVFHHLPDLIGDGEAYPMEVVAPLLAYQ